MKRFFYIGKIRIMVDMPDSMEPPAHFLLFETKESDYDYKYTLVEGQTIQIPDKEAVATREDFVVYQDGELETRLLGARGRSGFYGRYQEEAADTATITIDPAYRDLFSQDTVFSSLFALERRALFCDEIVLHCAYIDHSDQAILFSAPSGVGKSTQAALWEKYRKAAVKNGDRALITVGESGCTAYGWPVCGSSEICSNSSHPIRAIVMLSQAKDNKIIRLDQMSAFSQIYSQVTINSWNRTSAEKAINLIEKLISSVPVYHLSCDISKDAVDLLYDTVFQ